MARVVFSLLLEQFVLLQWVFDFVTCSVFYGHLPSLLYTGKKNGALLVKSGAS